MFDARVLPGPDGQTGRREVIPTCHAAQAGHIKCVLMSVKTGVKDQNTFSATFLPFCKFFFFSWNNKSDLQILLFKFTRYLCLCNTHLWLTRQCCGPTGRTRTQAQSGPPVLSCARKYPCCLVLVGLGETESRVSKKKSYEYMTFVKSKKKANRGQNISAFHSLKTTLNFQIY